MSNYDALSNLSPEDRQRLTEVINSEGEGILLVSKAGNLLTPVSPSMNFTGSGVNLTSVDGITTVNVPGGGGVGVSISAAEFTPSAQIDNISGASTDLAMFDTQNFQDDSDWIGTGTTLTCNRAGPNRYKFTVQVSTLRTSGADSTAVMGVYVDGVLANATILRIESDASVEANSMLLVTTALVDSAEVITVKWQIINSGTVIVSMGTLGSYVLVERMN